jgi:glucosamine--fructose-6-phosphate aminotransferase (isomerizing)
MCGIVGFVGDDDAVPILLNGLRRLEYRGYDSAGLACLSQGKLEIRRAAGKLANLNKAIELSPLQATVGIGHTRWATHGRPNETNAHPHVSSHGRLAIVHNGIVENYLKLRQDLKAQGVEFKSQTDSEVLAHLIEREMQGGADLAGGVRRALKKIEGSYALAVVCLDAPDEVVAARQGSPLVIGVGQGKNFLASDVPALLEHTRDVVFLDDGELAVIKKTGFVVTDLEGRPRDKKTVRITWDPQQAEKSGYKHFMLKEIFEQPRVVEDTLRGRMLHAEGDVSLEEISFSDDEVKKFRKIFLIACGTSWHAALVGKFLIEEFAGIPVEVDIGSEFRYRDPLVTAADLVIGISQSGETADTLAALRTAKGKGARVLAICNVVGSTMTRECEGTLYTHAGPEIGVASTKAFVSQIGALELMALYFGRRSGKLGVAGAQKALDQLRGLPRHIEQVLKHEAAIQAIAKKFHSRTDFLYIGRGLNYPIALEGALKLKEISYIHAEGYPAGEMKHGPIALIDDQMPVVAIAPHSHVYDKILSNIEEAKAREATVIAVVTEGDTQLAGKADHILTIPVCDEALTPILTIVPLQLLAYHISVLRGCDVDQPRNLAKSVTVE